MSVLTLDIDNRHVRIQGASRKVIRRLEAICSYKVAGHVYSQAFRTGRWDGREHLLKYSDKHGYRVAIGLLGDIREALEHLGVDYLVNHRSRRALGPRIEFEWNSDITLRPYQHEAIKALLQDTQFLFYGSGILKMPIRSGKTKTAAGVIHELKCRTLFIVPSQMLLHQTKASLEESLCCEVGMIGDGEFYERDITVATIQTLAAGKGGVVEDEAGKKKKIKPKPWYKPLLTRYDCVIFDECHHLRGDKWHKVMMDLDALYRIGLSATAYLDNERENERGVIWLKACCGPVRIDIDTSRLIEEGWLMRQHVELYVVREPNLHDRRGWSQSLLNEAIYENETRNSLVVTKAVEKVKQGLKVLIVSNRLNQIQLLAEMMEDQPKLNYSVVTGNDSSKARKIKVGEFTGGDCNVLVGTVFGEGIDIPEIECVINAEGGRDVKSTVQRMRNLTPHKDKVDAVFVDFMDMTNSYFAEHSKERLAAYRSEPAFVINVVKQ